jgi:hypothetical protein
MADTLTRHSVIETPADWRAAEMAARKDWIHELTGDEIAELRSALAHVKVLGKTLATMTCEDFPLPTLSALVGHCRDFLENSAGLFLIRGFPAAEYDKGDLRLLYWGLGKHMGTAVSQSANGDILGDVRNMNVDMNSPNGRGYTSNQKLTYHTDSCDVVGLFVLRTARSGGLSMIASSVAVHNEIARIRPDLLEVLYQPFYWSWQSQEVPGTTPYYQQPIFNQHGGKFSCRYVRTHIISAQRFEDVPRLTPQQEEAMALFDSLAGSEVFHFSMMFKPGDIQLLNNHVTVHSRTAFEDYDEAEKKRHLLRMWMSVPNSRTLSAGMHTIFQDQSAGAVRGGFPSRTGKLIYETIGSLE